LLISAPIQLAIKNRNPLRKIYANNLIIEAK
jgi:hypothetical protein